MRYRKIVSISVMIAMSTGHHTALYSQALTDQSSTITASIAMSKRFVPANEKPMLILSIRNLTNQQLSLGDDPGADYRVHVAGEDGEPPKTEFHRHLFGDFRPGDGPDLASGGIGLSLAPEATGIKKFDLKRYYELKSPAKYTVYMEVRDASNKWVITNTVPFEVGSL